MRACPATRAGGMFRLLKSAPVLRYRLLVKNGKLCGCKNAIFLGNRSGILYLRVLSNTLKMETRIAGKEASTATQSGKLKGVIESRMSRVRAKSIVSEPFVTDFSSK